MPRSTPACRAFAGLHLTPDETAALDAASDTHPSDYPYGELGVQQRDRSLTV